VINRRSARAIDEHGIDERLHDFRSVLTVRVRRHWRGREDGEHDPTGSKAVEGVMATGPLEI
jgi:hypothetical protein